MKMIPPTRGATDITNDNNSTNSASAQASSAAPLNTPGYNDHTDEEFEAWILPELLKRENSQLYANNIEMSLAKWLVVF